MSLLQLLTLIVEVLFVVLVFYIGYIAAAITLFLQVRSWENAMRVLICVALLVVHLLMFLYPRGVYVLFYGARLWLFLFVIVVLCLTFGAALILRIFSQRAEDRRLAIFFINYFRDLENAGNTVENPV